MEVICCKSAEIIWHAPGVCLIIAAISPRHIAKSMSPEAEARASLEAAYRRWGRWRRLAYRLSRPAPRETQASYARLPEPEAGLAWRDVVLEVSAARPWAGSEASCGGGASRGKQSNQAIAAASSMLGHRSIAAPLHQKAELVRLTS